MARTVTGRELADNQKTALYHRLLQLKKNGHVGSGDMKEIMRTFNVSQQTISRIWLGGCQTAADTGCARVASRKAAVVRLATASSEIHKTSLWNLFQANMLHPRTSRIGLWPIVETKEAARRTKNCDRGTPVTVPMTVTKPIYRRLLVDRVIPAILAKWPGRRGGTIYLQQGNARPHIAVDDVEVLAAGRKID
ncbi:hypothetical protein H257_18201 [Aphanomyces astaci]|uniref:DUF7769 domain-containing protein n=1 Tax=Aphanomyces astaci TaxID=112090 RepID=W4FBY6_APHAT|nr:hypothetical protein H257_18201 [Aphanomyces astaci]ETV64992.1 hypothetical protein H257_18201 [Aphanomyces astaci]|eukprot:XP_009845517.1 hypothetical protein H257_18201 [Aphanomyces astaci]